MCFCFSFYGHLHTYLVPPSFGLSFYHPSVTWLKHRSTREMAELFGLYLTVADDGPRWVVFKPPRAGDDEMRENIILARAINL